MVEATAQENEADLAVNDSSAFLVFSSKEDLTKTIEMIKNGSSSSAAKKVMAAGTRSAEISSVSKTTDFVSLLEANKQRCLAKLTQAQLDSVNNDEDDLEFCMADSVIADYEFAQLLNSSREIQVNDTVYKYYGNGVAFTPATNARMLKSIDKEVSAIEVTEHTAGKVQNINGNVQFVPYAYKVQVEESPARVSPQNQTRESLTLQNGVVIPANDIRDVNYDSKGDGGWLHRTWNNLWGRNVLAINKFNKHKRLRLGFYDQNYIVYANIGTLMKMQKKVCGIWWNCKADEIRVGWTAIELKYSFPKPVISYINPNLTATSATEADYPGFMKNKFPFKNEEAVLFHLPFLSYDLTVKDINKFLKAGIKAAAKQGPKYLQSLINSTKTSQQGLYSAKNEVMYVVTGPEEIGNKGKRTLEKKFYAKWFPGTYVFGFGYNGSFNLKSVNFDGGNSTKLARGIVYGAVKYKGRWLAARITKDN